MKSLPSRVTRVAPQTPVSVNKIISMSGLEIGMCPNCPHKRKTENFTTFGSLSNHDDKNDTVNKENQ